MWTLEQYHQPPDLVLMCSTEQKMNAHGSKCISNDHWVDHMQVHKTLSTNLSDSEYIFVTKYKI
jgi:hypothetical protein